MDLRSKHGCNRLLNKLVNISTFLTNDTNSVSLFTGKLTCQTEHFPNPLDLWCILFTLEIRVWS